MKTQGKQRYFWCAVDQDGDVVDVFVQLPRDSKGAKRSLGRLLWRHEGEPSKVVADEPRSKGVAHLELFP